MMKGISFSESNSFQLNIEFNRAKPPIIFVNPISSRSYLRSPRRSLRVHSLSVDSSTNRNAKSTIDPHAPPLVVVGSADISIDYRNKAKRYQPRQGKHSPEEKERIRRPVELSCFIQLTLWEEPTGHTVVMLQEDGQNSDYYSRWCF
ncbi:hypothetical protein F2Q70_00041589 [Brassica cretica]|uniref:Uncharacterized protein n=1 Tax=Brassica cretica TaxID=69181 RepID=A0A8S9MLG0_BRACR|nr:hypothetical protein F2Q70_00041589 [Brassica cretica]KAF2618306.1 hypothetical protein F2Q68_00042239 [Brassica cretica]